MDNIGGMIADSFDANCTHLTVTNASPTEKVVSALILGIPIVDMRYWEAVVSAIDLNLEFPDPDDFLLPLQDRGIDPQKVCLKPNQARQSIFSRKNFVFFSEKSYAENKKMINDAGGTAKIHLLNSMDVPAQFFDEDNIIMQISDCSILNDVDMVMTKIHSEMRSRGLRMIAVTEIPLAIIHVSLEQYCNPKYYFKDLMCRQTNNQESPEIVASDTQDDLASSLSTGVTLSSLQLKIPKSDNLGEGTATMTRSLPYGDYDKRNTSDGAMSSTSKNDTVLVTYPTEIRHENDGVGSNLLMEISSVARISDFSRIKPLENVCFNSVLGCESDLPATLELSANRPDSSASRNLTEIVSAGRETPRIKSRTSIRKLGASQNRPKCDEENHQTEHSSQMCLARRSLVTSEFVQGTERRTGCEDFIEEVIPFDCDSDIIPQQILSDQNRGGFASDFEFKKSSKRSVRVDLDDIPIIADDLGISIQNERKIITGSNVDSGSMSKVGFDKIHCFQRADENHKKTEVAMRYSHDLNCPGTDRGSPCLDASSLLENDWQIGIKLLTSSDVGSRQKMRLRKNLKSGNKVFKKTEYRIPEKRIALPEMMKWIPNERSDQ